MKHFIGGYALSWGIMFFLHFSGIAKSDPAFAAILAAIFGLAAWGLLP